MAISSNETDGLDGLNGGVLLIAFTAFTFIAFMHNKSDLCGILRSRLRSAPGVLMVQYLSGPILYGRYWRNRALVRRSVSSRCSRISVIALFIIVAIYGLESVSAALQLTSKHFSARRSLAAPLHHHFEAKGWPEPKVVMRAWIFTAVTALLGVLMAILGMGPH